MAEIHMPDDGENYPSLLEGKPLFWIAILLVLASAIFSVTYTVAPDEVGVVRRFGKYVRTTNPGLRFKLPYGIETVKKVRVTHIFKEEFGFRTKEAGIRTEYYDSGGSYPSHLKYSGTVFKLNSYLQKAGIKTQNAFLAESLMLTGDLNAAEVEWIIQYKIKDSVAYSFNVRDMRGTIRNMSEAVMRQVVGDATVDEVITNGKDIIEREAKERLQKVLDKLETGIYVTSVVLQDVNPPTQVKDSFNEVNEARQDKERFVNQAWQEYNREIPKAKGEALKLIRNAEGYAIQKINRAKGDAERFLATLKEYQAAKDITRKRLYIETMRNVLPNLNRKIVIDSKTKGILPLLNLNQEEGK